MIPNEQKQNASAEGARQNLQQWIAALRSGQYNQAKGNLRADKRQFCCLGVACHLYDSSRWEIGEDGYRYDSNYDSQMPPSVAKWLALDQLVEINDDDDDEMSLGDPSIPLALVHRLVPAKYRLDLDCSIEDEQNHVCLSLINDSMIPFNIIADIIEAYFIQGEEE